MRSALISNEQQIELIKKIKETGDQKSKLLLVQSLYPLILKTIGTRKPRYCEKEDLISEAMIGILDGFVRNFDQTRNDSVAYVAKKWILAFVKRTMLKSNSMINSGLSLKFRTIFWNWHKVQDKPFDEKLSFFKEMKQKGLIRVDVKEKDLLNYHTMMARFSQISIDSEVEDSRGRRTVPEGLIPSQLLQPEKLASLKQEFERFTRIEEKFMSSLTEREKEIWKESKIQSGRMLEIANFFGITRQRAQQVKKELRERFFKILLKNKIDKAVLQVFE